MLKIDSGNVRYFRLIPESFQKFFGKSEKGRMRQGIILKNNRLFGVFKYPIKAGRNSEFTPQIFIGVIFFNLAWPINSFSNSTGLFTYLVFFGSSSAVGNYKKFWRTGFSDLFKHPGGFLGSAKNKKCNWYFHEIATKYEILRKYEKNCL